MTELTPVGARCQDGPVTSSESSPDKPGTLRAYGGEAGDARVARRRAALIDAALDVFGDPEAASITVRGVCARAALTPRYFYESFTGVDQLIGAAYDEVIARLAGEAREAFRAAETPRERVEEAVRALLRVIESDPRAGRLLFADTIGGAVIAAKRAESITFLVQLTSESAREGFGMRPGPELTAAAYFQVGGLGRLLGAWSQGDIELDRERMVAVCVRMLLP